MDAIEAITNDLEGEQVDLERSLKLFQEGQTLINEANDRLQHLQHTFHSIAANTDAAAKESNQ